MPIVRDPGGASLIDVLDRVLDKGIVVDAWARVSNVGIDLTSPDAQVVVTVTEERSSAVMFAPTALRADGSTRSRRKDAG